jgi:hypothetical protein
MTPRLPVAIALLLLLLGGLWWVASLAPKGEAAAWEGPIYVVGPDGAVAANGTVRSQATPLAAVQALGRERGFGVEVEQQTWIGPGCTAAYVRGIGGAFETASGGWNYYVRSAGGAWTWQSAGAACFVLQPGQQLEWCWVESDVCRHHVP